MAAAPSMAQSGASPETPRFHADVKLVQVLATVNDSRGAPIGGLEREDFTMLAAGTPQQIAVFERQTDRPLSVVLLFDASPSVAKEWKFEQEAALRFVRSLLGPGAHPRDRIAVYKFSDYVQEMQGFTSSPSRLEKALSSIKSHGGTSVYDAIYLAAQVLENRQGRRVIVAITDGGDTTSSLNFSNGLEAAQRADAVVYSVIVVPITSDAGRNLGGENALKTISAATGGAAFRQHSSEHLDNAFRQIEKELRTQYLIAFYPRGIPAGTGHFHKIELQVYRPAVRVRARSGYYVSSTAEPPSGATQTVSLPGGPPREPKKAPGKSLPAKTQAGKKP